MTVPDDVRQADIEAINDRHRKVEWCEADEDGNLNPAKPLPPFCAECSDEDYVGAVENGDTIDQAADVVSWPCDAATAAGELRRLRAQVANIEALAVEWERAWPGWSVVTKRLRAALSLPGEVDR